MQCQGRLTPMGMFGTVTCTCAHLPGCGVLSGAALIYSGMLNSYLLGRGDSKWSISTTKTSVEANFGTSDCFETMTTPC